MLTAELKKLLVARSRDGKTLSIAPTGSLNQVTDLAAVSDAGGTQATLTWTEALAGDCNNDGEVGIADLQPIAAHYGESSSGPGSPAYLADADESGEVGITDLQPIAADYSMHIEGYQVWRGHFNGASTDWEATFRPNVGNPTNTSFSSDRPSPPPVSTRPTYTYLDDISGLADKTNVRYKVTAYGDGAAGAESNEAIMPPPTYFSVSGTVTESGVGLAGVLMTLTPGGLNAVTQADGTYTLNGLPSGPYTLSPFLTGFSFMRPVRQVTIADADVTGQDFAAMAWPAVAPWPQFHGNAQHTGLSAYQGAQSPTILWSLILPALPSYNLHSSPAVAVDESVFIGDDTGHVYGVNPDGTIRWTVPTEVGAVVAVPAIGAGGTVYARSISTMLYALDGADGGLKWTASVGSTTGSPTIGADGTIYLGSDWGGLFAINPDGSLKWRYSTPEETSTSPAVGLDGTVFFASAYDFFALNPDGTLKWKHAALGTTTSSPAVGADGTIYVGATGGLYAINPDASLKWSYSTGGQIITSSPAIGSDGTVYAGCTDGKLYAINPDGSLKWTYTTGWVVASSPAIGNDGTIYFGSNDGFLYALNSDGTLKWSLKMLGKVSASPAIGADGRIYASSSAGDLTCIGP
jgi:outer membrane protein assembly factor BamB